MGESYFKVLPQIFFFYIKINIMYTLGLANSLGSFSKASCWRGQSRFIDPEWGAFDNK
jgi:hypothetical protein